SHFPKAIHEALAALAELAQSGARLEIGSDGDGDRVPLPRGATTIEAGGGAEQLELAEARYRGLIEQIPAVTFLAKLSGGRNEMYVSPQIESLLGFTQSEWLDDPVIWYRQTHPADRERVSRNFAATCLTGRPFREVFRVFTKSGETVWVNAAAKLVRDANGELLFLQGVGFDVTEQFKAAEAREQLIREQAARAQADRDRNRLREMFTNLPAALWLLAGDDHRVEIMNPVAQRLFDVTFAAIGKPFATVVPELAEQVLPDLEQIRRGEKTVLRREIGLVSPRWPTERHFSFICQALRGYEGGLLLAHATETTEQVHAQRKIEEALRLRDQFLAIAAHELRTPITSMLGRAQFALRVLERQADSDRGPLARSLRTIVRQSTTMAQLISQLLDLSRLQSGKLIIEPAPTDLVPIVDDIVDNARLLSTSHEITFINPPSLEAEVDPLRVEQVVTNLVQNAIKYSPDGGAIEVVLRSVGRSLELSVRDHGLGIPPERRGQIFEQFYQAHSGQQGGLGLGLYISRQIVQLHGGEIRAEFPDDGGTRFVVTIPLSARRPERTAG
ncbi:MAG TPA: PAS domain-containing sensor histidine kinase, partial [Candidatus Limnocylindria bacterium]|nr:PAS domain-containing sensor histidine kinase [Candidatus Limnocylindria bacterium]